MFHTGRRAQTRSLILITALAQRIR